MTFNYPIIITRRKLKEIEDRILSIERHFVTKRAADGSPTETLADIPPEKRKDLKQSLRGLSWPQRRAILEATEGGRKVG